jgi:uncharacterized RDD family membrane protein YckC
MEDQWYVGRKGQKSGPYTTAQLRQMAAAGELVPTDLLWKQGLEQWVPMTSVRGLLPAAAGGTLPPLALQNEPAGGRPGGADWNPYEANANASLAVPAGEQQAVYADFVARIGASVLDFIFVFIISIVLQLGLPLLVGGLLGLSEDAVGMVALLGLLGSVAFSLLYFIGYETSSKQGTWGKQIVGIKVTDIHGRRISVGRAFGRYFAKILSNMTCGIGYLLPLFTERKQTLHDLICGCLALKK